MNIDAIYKLMFCILPASKNFIASSERAWKNKPIGLLMLYSISSSSEVIRKNVQNISCWFSTTCDVIGWVGMFNEY
jgi:hypothetical protein